MQIEIEMQLTPRTSFSCLIVRSVSLYILLSYGVKDRQKYAINLKFSHVEYIFVFIFTFVWRRIEKYALLLKCKRFFYTRLQYIVFKWIFNTKYLLDQKMVLLLILRFCWEIVTFYQIFKLTIYDMKLLHCLFIRLLNWEQVKRFSCNLNYTTNSLNRKISS